VLLLVLAPASADDCSTLAIYVLEHPASGASYSPTSNIYFDGYANAGEDPHANVEIWLKVLHTNYTTVHREQKVTTNSSGEFEFNFPGSPPWPYTAGWAAVFCGDEVETSNDISIVE
jgi:hypothetical protein